MNEFALLKNGKIATVVTTPKSMNEIIKKFPEYEVDFLHNLPLPVLSEYKYWNERA